MDKHRDFDQFFKEADEKKGSVTLTLYGEVWTLPNKIPAKILLETYKAYKDGIKNIPEGQQIEMAISVLGEENVEAWIDRDISIEQLTEIMTWAVQQTKNNGDDQVQGSTTKK